MESPAAPASVATNTETTALGVPAAGYRTALGSVAGFAGSPICQNCTGVSSTRAVRIADPSGAHQYPRVRSISSAAMNSARPKLMPSAPSGSASALVRAGCDVVNPQRTVADVGDVRASRVWPGISGWRPGGELAHDAAVASRSQVGQVDDAREREGSDRALGIHGESDDAACPLPYALPPCLLDRVVLRAGLAEIGRVSDQPLLAGADVECPQAGHRVGAASGAQEDDGLAVGRQPE